MKWWQAMFVSLGIIIILNYFFSLKGAIMSPGEITIIVLLIYWKCLDMKGEKK